MDGKDSLHHGRPLQRQTPTEDSNVRRDTHGLKHLRTEHPRVPDLDGLVELGVVLEDLERGLKEEEGREEVVSMTRGMERKNGREGEPRCKAGRGTGREESVSEERKTRRCSRGNRLTL